MAESLTNFIKVGPFFRKQRMIKKNKQNKQNGVF